MNAPGRDVDDRIVYCANSREDQKSKSPQVQILVLDSDSTIGSNALNQTNNRTHPTVSIF